MRPLGQLGVVVVLVGIVLLLVLPQFFLICADPGGCHAEIVGQTLLPGAVVCGAGLVLIALSALSRTTA